MTNKDEFINMSSKLELNKTKPEEKLFISRPTYQQEDVMALSGYSTKRDTITETAQKRIKQVKFTRILFSLIPVLQWLPKYNIGENLLSDTMAGITVAVMHIPQGMAYGLLANLPPIVGLYMAFFPVLAYFVFGTSRHISMGTFAIASLMVSKVVTTYAKIDEGEAPGNGTINALAAGSEETYTPLEVVSALTLLVGLYHLLMFALNLGKFSTVLNEPLVNGFTTAAAVHVVVSQTKDLLGVPVHRYSGAFKVIYTVSDLIRKIPQSNMTAVYLSAIVILFMIIMNEFIKPWAKGKCRFPVPAELFVVVTGTLASYYLSLGPTNGIKLVGNIPTGLPTPTVPKLALLKLLAGDAIAITIVTYSVVLSMALTFGRKLHYAIIPNQELFAMGMSNIVGSFFMCIPNCCSLSRSLIQHQTGGKTQVASVVSSGLILVVLLWIGPYFESLPRAVLAGIIVVALKGMLYQVQDVKRFKKEGPLEVIVWLTTFFGVVLIDIEMGLLAGVIASLISLYFKGWRTEHYLLGVIPDSGIYVDLAKHKNANEIPFTKIFKYTGSINFAYTAYFKKVLFKSCYISVKQLRRASQAEGLSAGLRSVKTIIVDLSSVAHLDITGCKMLTEISKELQLLEIAFLLASPSDSVYDSLEHAQSLAEGPFHIFPTIQDAIVFSQKKVDLV